MYMYLKNDQLSVLNLNPIFRPLVLINTCHCAWLKPLLCLHAMLNVGTNLFFHFFGKYKLKGVLQMYMISGHILAMVLLHKLISRKCKQASKQTKNKKTPLIPVFHSKGGVWTPKHPPPPPSVCVWALYLQTKKCTWLIAENTGSASKTTKALYKCVPQKRKPINLVNFSENCNDLSEKAYIFTKFSLSSFFWHQIQDVLTMHEQALTISNGDVKNDLRRMGI